MRAGVALTTATVVALLDCSSGGGGSGGGDPCSQYWEAQLSYQSRCGTSSTQDPAQAEATRSRFLTFCANLINAPGAATLGQNLSACASKASTVSCGENTDCDIDSGGTQPDGASCTGGFQCKSGACDSNDDECGHCIPVAAIGAECGSTDTKVKCPKNATCAGQGGKNTCQPYVKAKAGESCQSSATNFVTCDTNLTCVTAPDNKSATCQPRGAAGTACTGSSDCQRNLVCNKKVCGTGEAAGGDCSDGGACARGLVCTSTDHRCTAVTFVAGGQTCDDTHKCSRGRCKRAASTGPNPSNSGTCEDPLPDGAACKPSGTSDDATPCDEYAECVSGKCQIPNPATCQ